MTRRTLYVQLIIAFMCVAMVAYLVMLGRVAVAMIGSPRRGCRAGAGAADPAGHWAVGHDCHAAGRIRVSAAGPSDRRRRTGHRRQRAARRASGRIQRDAADALFAAVRTELEDDADDWRRWYRLARAYDYAGIGAARGKR